MTKFSFCVITYNQVNEIDEVLGSIFDQNPCCSFEVIVSDDGSDDGTIDKIKKWQLRYPDKLKLYIQPRELGDKTSVMARISNSIRCALDNMTGDYFCLFDGDDYCKYKNFASDAVSIMENNNSVNTVLFDFEYRFPDRIEKSFYNNVQEGIIDKKTFFGNNYAHSGAMVFRNNLTPKRIELLTSVPFVIDNTIIPFMLNVGKLYYLPEVAYSYRVSGGTWDKRTSADKAVFTVLIDGIIAKIAPEFQIAFRNRIRHYFTYIFDNKNFLKKNMTNDLFEEYSRIAYKYDKRFAYKCLNWKNLKFFERWSLKRYYKKLMNQKNFLKNFDQL